MRDFARSIVVATGLIVATTASTQEPLPGASDFATWLARADEAADAGKSEEAVKAATKAIELAPKQPQAYYLRGRERFRLGQFAESVADFDRYVELEPTAASRQWERGIALYYAGEYEKGAKQFALYQTYHDSDVENSTWRYLCVARTDGVEKARENLLPIENDRRVPMMAIYRLYRGEATPDEVFEAARAGDPDEAELAGRLFYAQLYVGLWHEAAGQNDLARKYLLQAADDHGQTRTINRYMYDVARVHAAKLRASDEKSSGDSRP